MNGSEDLLDNGNWTWTSKSAADDVRMNSTRRAIVPDPSVGLLRHVVEVWLTTPIVLLGIIGNVIAFFVLCQHRRHKLQTTTVILQALAVADTLVLLIIFLLRSLRYVVPLITYVEYRDAHKSLYSWLFPSAYVLRMINGWLTVLLTVDRYIAVCRPLHAQRLCTIQRAYSNIIAVIVASIIFCLPRFFENYDRNVPSILDNKVYVIIYRIILFLLVQYLIPMILLTVLNSYVIMSLRRSNAYRTGVLLSYRARTPPLGSSLRSINSATAVAITAAPKPPTPSMPYSSAFESARRVTIIVIVVVLMCIICYTVAMTAQVIYSLQIGFRAWLGHAAGSVDLCRRYIAQLSNLLLTLNSASNFIVYCLCSRNFRAVLSRRLCCVVCCCRRRRRRRQATGRQCGSPPGQRAAGAGDVPMAMMPLTMPAAAASAPDFRMHVHWRGASLPRKADGRISTTTTRLSRVLLPFRYACADQQPEVTGLRHTD